MKNIIHYVEEMFSLFSEHPFSSVDSLVLSQLVYIRLPSCVPVLGEEKPLLRLGDLLRAECFESMFRNVRDPENNRRLLFALAASPRFRNILVGNYSEQLDIQQEKQFAAVTFYLDTQTAYIAFRGTDATFIGWKEDFNMAFQSPVPSQEEALIYLNSVAKQWPGTFLIGGHSKGGNLAVYSAMMSPVEIQNRIRQIYSHDGPGFKAEILQSSNFDQIQTRIHKTLPQSSIVGMLLENQEPYSIVKSNRFGIMQHDPFSWIVEEKQFSVLERLSVTAKHMDHTLNGWLQTLSDGERERFIDTLYTVLNAGGITDFSQLETEWQKSLSAMLNAARNIEPDAREFAFQTLKSFVTSGIRNLIIPPKALLKNEHIEK
ncbi:DUF2974 domain-containing protein [Clostridium minihomine]|uniref:DUF2974 domain-containing protein n=1 Tax=Clostridium minihomine TaxID=2045012 RepID=UPI000C785EAC|nr:DUF2974 domain-containing protein [Clostridium minihomine]